MPSDNASFTAFPRKRGRALVLVLSRIGVLLVAGGCATTSRFPLRDPLWRDRDDRAFAPAPEEYESPFAWDAANQTLFRPIARFFAVDPAGPAVNVNAFDEVPDSSWFTNRLGRVGMSPEEIARGACDSRVLDPNMPDGSWVIDKGKDNGANPGFRVNVPRLGKFMLKPDLAEEPERATGATAVASRIYHAVGYFAPCDSIVYFRPSILRLTPGLQVTNNQGVTKPFDADALARILEGASHRGGLVRMVASQWLPGKPLGPYSYDGLRDDDPNDVIPHEDRRELRAARLIAAWLNHFDAREQNTMDVFLPANPARRDGPGHVRHYIMDLGDCFGSVWPIDAFSRQFGHAYLFDVPYLTEDFVTLGAIERPWERARRVGGIFNYFSSRDFDPELWRSEYPNPAFGRMTEADGAWVARILAHFEDHLVAAAVEVGAYDAASTRYLTQTLIKRRDAILRRYLSRLSPIGGLHIERSELCGVDFARKSRTVPQETVSFRARHHAGGALEPKGPLIVTAAATGRVCVRLVHTSGDAGPPDADPARYLVVDISNGYSRGPLRAHLYDLGPRRGFRLVGIERPEDEAPPR
jgi:hypothetical protein